MSILIKNGRIIDPAQGIDQISDILIEEGKVSCIGPAIKTKAKETIDAKGKIVAPGFIDMHTHLREPGGETAETIYSGTRAAVRGGFTTVCAMPNTAPACDSYAGVKFLLNKAEEINLANVLPIAAITKNRHGKEISEMAEIKKAWCLAVSDDGSSVEDALLLRRAMEYASMLGLLVISHCEDSSLSNEGVMHEGYFSTVLGLKPIPALAESSIVARDIRLAELTGARLHIAHVSTAESVEIIRLAKKRGVKVTAEATPHHFSLTDEALKGYDTNVKVNPPLRGEEDVKAIKLGLSDGTIDAIATDHAPHLENEKQKEFDYAPFGMIGLETALSLCITKLIDEKILDWTELIKKLSSAPAEILEYNRGTLKQGAVADVVVIDPDKEWNYDKESRESKSSNSPFIGKRLKGAVTDVIIEGRIVMREGSING
ncbi:MAG: dihydroorotase [Candidatus Omnitrophota bacterium]